MPKAKKSDSEKAAKAKNPKPSKAEKPAKEKKKKAKAAEEAPKPAPVKKAVAEKPKRAAAAPVEIVLTIEDISLRAYFISERRQAMGWPGDSTQDWVEAERQLKAEAKKKAKR